MKRLALYIGIFTCLWFTACTKNNYYDSGICNGQHDCSLLEYMEQHSYDWDSTALMVRHAGAIWFSSSRERILLIRKSLSLDLRTILFVVICCKMGMDRSASWIPLGVKRFYCNTLSMENT